MTISPYFVEIDTKVVVSLLEFICENTELLQAKTVIVRRKNKTFFIYLIKICVYGFKYCIFTLQIYVFFNLVNH